MRKPVHTLDKVGEGLIDDKEDKRMLAGKPTDMVGVAQGARRVVGLSEEDDVPLPDRLPECLKVRDEPVFFPRIELFYPEAGQLRGQGVIRIGGNGDEGALRRENTGDEADDLRRAVSGDDLPGPYAVTASGGLGQGPAIGVRVTG